MYAILYEVVVDYSNWNEAAWSSLKLKKLFEYPQKWIKLFEVTQNWTKMFHLARIWMELLLFGQSRFSLLEFTKFFQFMETFLSPAKTTFLAELCNRITRQAIELESCSNPLRIQQVF